MLGRTGAFRAALLLPLLVAEQSLEAVEHQALAADCAALSRAAAEPSPAQQQGAAQAVASLAAAVIGRAIRPGRDENVVLSPLGLASVLDLLANGAVGETAAELAKVLGEPTSRAPIAALSPKLVPRSSEVTFRSANAMFAAEDLQVNPDFVRALAGELRRQDFGAPDALQQVNGWFAEQTAGRIPALFSQLPLATRLVLGNAVYFHAHWATPFLTRATQEQPFRTASGQSKPVSMMRLSHRLAYRQSEGLQMVRLPYVGDDYVLTLVVPDDKIDLARWLAQPKNSQLLVKTDEFALSYGQVGLPRLELTVGGDVTPLLADLGLARALSREAQYGCIGAERLVVDQFVQKVFLKVDEVGTEAAAATGATAFAASMALPMDPFRVIADRPFLLRIDHLPTGTPLFIGYIGDAAAK